MVSLKRPREVTSTIEPESIVSSNQEDLAVNPKKLKELADILLKFKNTRKSLVLVLHGPHGSGKTAAVLSYAKHLDLKVQQWSPIDSDRDLTYCDQLQNFLKSTCSIKKPLKIPGCIPKELPSILLIDAFPLMFSENSKWSTVLSTLSAYSDKLICFNFSNTSSKLIHRLFEGTKFSILE